MIESNIASGPVNGLVEGKHFNRCRHLHPLMALGLQMLHFDPFLKMDNIEYNFLNEQVIDDILHYQEVIDSHSTMPIEIPNNVLSRVLPAYQKFVEETRQDEHEPTLLENQNKTQDNDYDNIDNNGSSDDDDDYEDVSVFFTE
ncbi:uncharacterized protein TNCV_637831 [Trichonephila clavipes]|nr:uncharacterized protein TNCV_637831 [Trichonephila clavipes]